MPYRPDHQCNYSGCKRLTIKRFCSVHAAIEAQEYEKQRESAAKRGYDHRWHKARCRWLRLYPICVECHRPATVVDHKIPHKGNMVLFWDRSNWQSMCNHCHNVKRQREAMEARGYGQSL
jgi:5-methylcytosine-specific restriction protein A